MRRSTARANSTDASLEGSMEQAPDEAALEAIRAEMVALPKSEVMTINLRIPDAALLVLGVLPQIRRLRADFVHHLRTFDVSLLDRVETYALAATHADTMFLASSASDDLLAPSRELSTIREVLLGDARVLVARRLLDGKALQQLRSLHGFENVTLDVLALAALLGDNWSSIQGRTAVTLDDLEHAKRLASNVMRALGLRKAGVVVTSQAADTRQRAYTLFVRAYGEVRRAVLYLRHYSGDADVIAPSLFRGRGGSRKKSIAGG